MHKMQICFEKGWNWTMSNIIDEVHKKINKPKGTCRLISYVASYATCQIIDTSRLANEVRS